MVKNKKRYIGSFPSEVEAARAYDIAALLNHGARAKTNYEYSAEEQERLKSNPDHRYVYK